VRRRAGSGATDESVSAVVVRGLRILSRSIPCSLLMRTNLVDPKLVLEKTVSASTS
jgi:hypothetical protein